MTKVVANSQFQMKHRLFFLTFCLFTCGMADAQVNPKREMRAAWIATVLNIDWPSQKGLTAQQQQDEFVALLDKLRSVGMNAVIVQVRPTSDAFYPSSFDPWSEYLSGTQGESPQPYYNPLTFMIEQARLRCMEFHAWFNPYRASMKEDFIPSENHPLRQHPEWFLRYGGKWYYDPGHPESREYVLQSIMETVKHYDIDAVHFDDYFYPYRIGEEQFPDDSSYVEFGQTRFENKDDWRRNNVDVFVGELSRRIKKEKQHVKFGISPFGVWRNHEKDSTGSLTQAGQTNYDDLYADVLKWLKEGWIDYVTPQIYWHIGFEKAEYRTLAEWWSKNSYGRHLYIGQGIYRVGQKGWEDTNQIVRQIGINRSTAEIKGSMYFSAKVFAENRKGVNQKIDSVYKYKALVPTMPWINGQPLSPPKLEKISGTQRAGLKLEWKDDAPSGHGYYIIYRFKGKAIGSADDPANIVAIISRQPRTVQSWIDTGIKKRTIYTYAVTCADRLHNESSFGKAASVKTRGIWRGVKLYNLHD
jgi:uncharacterized lipoprotein YddW (UPF0748 family)